jgi:hypothetical protein
MLKYKIQINDNLTLLAEGNNPEEAYDKVEKAIEDLKLLKKEESPDRKFWKFMGVVDE